jgi:hypothetical protein
MKAFLGGVAAMIVIAVAAAVALNNLDYSSATSVSSERGSLRLGDNP